MQKVEVQECLKPNKTEDTTENVRMMKEWICPTSVQDDARHDERQSADGWHISREPYPIGIIHGRHTRQRRASGEDCPEEPSMRRAVEQGGTHALQEWTIKEDRKRRPWHRPKEIAHQALPDECVALMTWTMKAAKVAGERHIRKYEGNAGLWVGAKQTLSSFDTFLKYRCHTIASGNIVMRSPK